MDSLTTRFRDEVFAPYLELLKAQYRIHPRFQHAKRMWEEKLTAKELINGPYLEKAQTYAQGEPLEALPLNEKTIETIRKNLRGPGLYKHQTDALRLLLAGENAIIATGASSGKTLCYQIPILDDLLRDPTPGLRAVIIYPLNALVNDQLDEWERMLKGHNQITFARFTGQTPKSQIDYENRIKNTIEEQLADEGLTQQQKQQEVQRRLLEQLNTDVSNRLNHRDDIRANPPHVLITNFSMLEYLLERPVDAPIFEGAHLKFLVLDEVHAYRGVQATEIAFLIRRLKDRLGLEKLTCIATSATLGKKDNAISTQKVRDFAHSLFGEEFDEGNPIYGTSAQPLLRQRSFRPSAAQYMKVADTLRDNIESDIRDDLGLQIPAEPLISLLSHDENLYRLRHEILTRHVLLSEAAKELWPSDPQAADGLQALLEIAATASAEESCEDLLPTRLHYFVRAQDGLHICLHKECPGRCDGNPAVFVSRTNDDGIPDGYCPDCHRVGRRSQLVEIVTCRKCGYLFGALQDLGPRRAQNPDPEDKDTSQAHFDSFSTELGWAADSFWSYICVEDELPFPSQSLAEEDEDEDNLMLNPAQLEWCVICGKKQDPGRGDNCTCESPHLRKIRVFHRQCPYSGKPSDLNNLYSSQKKPLTYCPNCGARNSSGLEPLRRFQESDDETGLAMAIPLSHFQVSPPKDPHKPPRKLLCFTDHRQRAAAFPSLLEEETFTRDMGRKLVEIVPSDGKALDLIGLGERLADIADPQSDNHDANFFLPVSRFPDEAPDARGKRDLWVAETLSYFGIPDSARESAEDLGLVAIEYRLSATEQASFSTLLSDSGLALQESIAALQVLLGFVRQRKAFTLGRVQPDAPAFGRVTADIGYVLRREGNKNTVGWIPHVNKDSNYRDNFVTSYLRRLTGLSPEQILRLAENIWDFLTFKSLLIERNKTWRLDHERIFAVKPESRYVCNRCGIVTAYSARSCCPRKACVGRLEARPFDAEHEGIITRWVSGKDQLRFTTLKSEEHTAQISKDLAKRIEDEFRVEGVNLLSSTTTFEMGINIGDLQKVLLRNAPPSSANYVQRVGRAGRGKDKNAVCVTLCRRTKYDGDAWEDPTRLMSGEIRTPSVFLQNRVISQRHFNAVAFARFLRIKVMDERALGKIEQQIPLEVFLPSDSRTNIPERFRVHRTDLFLDFLGWLNEQDEGDIFKTKAGQSLLYAVSGFDEGRMATEQKYGKVVENIAEDLAQLMSERHRLYKQGAPTGDADRAVKGLLGSDVIAILAKRGFLPRYAFPLDVVTLETGWTRWSRDSDVELSRDRGIAIAEFAPGAQVIAHKKVFTSEGLYIVSNRDKPQREWYSQCPDCGQIRTDLTQDPLVGACPICGRSITTQWIKPFVEPLAFSVRVDKRSEGAARHRRSTLVRQRQAITHFIDSIDEAGFDEAGSFRLALKESGKLFRYNLGPRKEGFMLCHSCGYSEPKVSFKAGSKHKRLRAFSGSMNCENPWPWTKPLAYGHQFQSYCLIARPIQPLRSVESIAFALQKGLCITLDIEQSDIGVSWRWLAKRTDVPNNVEIVMYDNTPGGAGFVKEGYENWPRVMDAALDVCDKCTCEKACYDCLKYYGNQSYHEKLDRYQAKEALRQ